MNFSQAPTGAPTDPTEGRSDCGRCGHGQLLTVIFRGQSFEQRPLSTVGKGGEAVGYCGYSLSLCVNACCVPYDRPTEASRTSLAPGQPDLSLTLLRHLRSCQQQTWSASKRPVLSSTGAEDSLRTHELLQDQGGTSVSANAHGKGDRGRARSPRRGRIACVLREVARAGSTGHRPSERAIHHRRRQLPIHTGYVNVITSMFTSDTNEETVKCSTLAKQLLVLGILSWDSDWFLLLFLRFWLVVFLGRGLALGRH